MIANASFSSCQYKLLIVGDKVTSQRDDSTGIHTAGH
jgi:hypothetical protein